MDWIEVTEESLLDAGRVHSESWKASHRTVCSPAFVDKHTPEAQALHLRREMAAGKRVYMLTNPHPVGIVSVDGSLIENLYVLPGEQHRGYGTMLLRHAVSLCRETPTLWILSTNENARRFYLRNGFAETGRRKLLKDQLFEVEMSLCAASEPSGAVSS